MFAGIAYLIFASGLANALGISAGVFPAPVGSSECGAGPPASDAVAWTATHKAFRTGSAGDRFAFALGLCSRTELMKMFVIAFLAIVSSFFGHYLGASEGLIGLTRAVADREQRISDRTMKMAAAVVIFAITWGAAIVNPGILATIESLSGSVMAMLIFLLPMYAVNQDKHGTAYTVTVDAKEGVGTGISLPQYAPTSRITGVDLSDAMLDKARERVRKLYVIWNH